MKTGIIILFLSYVFATPVWLQNVSLDPDFGPNGNGYSSLYNLAEGFSEMTIRPDKSIVMIGYVANSSEFLGISLAAFTANGIPDSTFGNAGLVVLHPDSIQDGFPREIIALPDGKILVGAYIYTDTEDAFLLMQLRNDGSLDSTFGDEGILKFIYSEGTLPALSFAVDVIGNIFLIGMYENHQALSKLLPDGSPDLTFGEEGIAVFPTFQDSAWVERGSDIFLMPDGKIITTAAVIVDETITGFVTSKWKMNGTPDNTFGDHGSQFFYTGEDVGIFCSIHPQPDGRILYKDYFSYSANMRLFRLDQNGMPDLSFGDNGSVFMESVYGPITNEGLLICPDGSILMPYSKDQNDIRQNSLYRFHSDFSPDTAFGNENKFAIPNEILGIGFLGIILQENNKIVLNMLSENNSYYYNTLVRLNIDNHVSTNVVPSTNSLISICPNPASERIILHFENTETVSANLELIDSQGRILQRFAENLRLDAGENQLTFELSEDIPPGIAFVKLTTGSAGQIYPMMIIR